jgi:hypothetical protein
MSYDYEDLDPEKDLSIDKFNLDKDVLSHSGIYFRYSELCVDAKNTVVRLKDKLELQKAEEELKVRDYYKKNEIKYTESVIASEVIKSPAVVSLLNSVRDAEEVFNKLQVAVNAFEARKSQLDNAVKLFCANYWSMNNEDKQYPVSDEVSSEIRRSLNKSKELRS